MGTIRRSRKGSLAYRPRKRATSQMPSIGHWPQREEKCLLGFAGYKAGMTHMLYIDDSLSPNKGSEVSYPVTVIDAPPIVVYGIRGYKGGVCVGDVICDDEKIRREIGLKKKKSNEITPDKVDNVFVLAYAQPGRTKMGKKRPERMEIGVGGKDTAEKLDYAKGVLGKEIRATDVFKQGEYIDTISISKGKGWQGAVKRFGVSLQRRKATGKRRHVGTLGAWHPASVLFTVPMAGQMGYHKRTEKGKRIMKMGEGKEINPRGGFPQYGLVRDDYVLVGGSVAGPRKRLIRMRKSVLDKAVRTPEIRYISTEPKG
jgi:large subunit ribosomal protein L3